MSSLPAPLPAYVPTCPPAYLPYLPSCLPAYLPYLPYLPQAGV